MTTQPTAYGLALLLGLSFFLGLAFEDSFARAGTRRPGGIRTFPLLAIVGGMLYWLEPTHLVPFTGGLLVLGAWLLIYYRAHIGEPDEDGQPNVGIVVLLLNVYAYLLGAVALALPHWVAVATAVAAVLLFASRSQLHALARRVEQNEIVTAAQFLVLTGIVLPLLPDEAVTTLTKITPRDAWLALLVVCTLSYASYLLQRYIAPKAGGLLMAALGGLYSSTATTVVLARQAASEPGMVHDARAGITLASAIMYLRILVVVAVFNLPLARSLAPALVGLSAAAFVCAAIQYKFFGGGAAAAKPQEAARNPLELGAAAIFALLFVATSLISNFVTQRFGEAGIDALAAVIGVADIDPFVLNLAQGGVAGPSTQALASAVLIAAASNNLLKACYATFFAGPRIAVPSIAVLVALAAAGVAAALL